MRDPLKIIWDSVTGYNPKIGYVCTGQEIDVEREDAFNFVNNGLAKFPKEKILDKKEKE